MEEETKPRFVLSNAAELLAKPEPQIEWLIENMWVDKARGLIAGNPGVGKTWLALDMLIAVASGGLCMGRFASKQGAVLLVEEEGSELNLSRRLHSMARARGLKGPDLANLHLLTRQFTKIPADTVELFHLIAHLDIKLIVFDSLRRFHGADENSSSEMQPVLDSFARLNVMTGAAIVLIHHLSKGTRENDNRPIFERLRGSSDFWAWRDCLIGVEGEEEAEIATYSFQFRDAESPEPIMAKRHVGELSGAIGLEVLETQDTEEFNERAERILAYMRTQYGSISRNQINDNIKGKKADILRTIKAMVKQKMLVKDGLKLAVPETVGTNGNHGN
jgi:RecA-family ATPase